MVVRLYMSALWWTGDLSTVYPASPHDAGIGSRPPATPNRIKRQKMNEWKNILQWDKIWIEAVTQQFWIRDAVPEHIPTCAISSKAQRSIVMIHHIFFKPWKLNWSKRWTQHVKNYVQHRRKLWEFYFRSTLSIWLILSPACNNGEERFGT